jgi:protein O-mannosyl-transferase
MDPAPVRRRPDLRRDGLAAAALFGVTLIAFTPALQCDFVNFDDHIFTFNRQQVLAGLTMDGARWAFTTFDTGNWHPLTWLSLQLDASLWKTPQGGLDPRGFHLTNVLLHAANAALLFLALRTLSGAFWRSAATALLFAVHPLRVESVAWIAERKDVLSVFFGLLALWAYAVYARTPSVRSYLAMALAFALSLMCKPMLVTLPCLLVVLDWWPLGRARTGRDFWRLAIEKLPLVGLAVACALVTVRAQAEQAAIGSFEKYSLAVRLQNAVVSYAEYLSKTVWPAGLAVFYPHPGANLAAWQVAGSVLLLTGLTAGAVVLRRRAPYLAVGWLWYLGTLVPVIGLVQVGKQAYADRYSYFPQIGLLVAICWGTAAFAGSRKRTALVAAGAAALSLMAVTLDQLQVWRNSVTLWENALKISGPDSAVLQNLGVGYETQNRLGDAAQCYRRMLKNDPGSVEARINIGALHARQRRLDDAAEMFRQACDLDPNSDRAQMYLGKVLLLQNKPDEAARHYEEVVRLTPDLPLPYCELGKIEMSRNNFARAADWFQKATDVQPNFPDARAGLGIALFRAGQTKEGIEQMFAAIRCDPRSGQRHVDLGKLLEAQGDMEAATEQFAEAVELSPGLASARVELGMALARQGRKGEALDCLVHAVERDSSLLTALPERLAAAGLPDLARMIMERCRTTERGRGGTP